MSGLPESIQAEIANKRTPSSEDHHDDESNVNEKQNADDSQKDESKKSDAKPEPKKGEAAKPKNGQSIAQVAEAANEDDDEDDEDDEDGDGDPKTKSKKRSSIFSEFMENKRELKEMKKSNRKLASQYTEMAQAMTELVGVVKDLKGNKSAQRDEIEEFAEEWGLNPEGTKKLADILEKRLSTKAKTSKSDSDDEDDDDDDDEPKKKTKSKSPDAKAELSARRVELAIEAEYDDYIDSFPQVKSKLNLKAIKRYIMGDDENLSKSFADVVSEMYPGVLTGKSSIDGGSDINGGGEDDETPDWNDSKVQQRVQKDPKLRDQYHNDLLGRVKGIYK